MICYSNIVNRLKHANKQHPEQSESYFKHDDDSSLKPREILNVFATAINIFIQIEKWIVKAPRVLAAYRDYG